MTNILFLYSVHQYAASMTPVWRQCHVTLSSSSSCQGHALIMNLGPSRPERPFILSPLISLFGRIFPAFFDDEVVSILMEVILGL